MREEQGAGPTPCAFSLQMRLCAPTFVDDLRRFTEQLVGAARVGDDRGGQLALAVHELVENAIRHGGRRPIELEVAVAPERDEVTIEVRNACGRAQYDALRARLDRLEADPDALHAYVETIRSTPHTVRGGLGLPRVRFEAELELDARHDGERVTITARGGLAPARPVTEVSHA
jgi:anti-sigma regulatory factor (Ser/Thr protein kinase)